MVDTTYMSDMLELYKASRVEVIKLKQNTSFLAPLKHLVHIREGVMLLRDAVFGGLKVAKRSI